MKAAVVTRYGPPDVVGVREVLKPEPAPSEILIRVHATTVSRTDGGELRGRPFFIYGRRPKRTIFGLDFAGMVEAVGARTTLFKPGDRVFGMCPSKRNGAHAEYVCIPEGGPVATMPAGLPFEQAVVCEGAFYADTALKKLGVAAGDKILVYGASGAIGTAAVQLAKYYGAEATAVVPTRHIAMATALGADRVVDYTAEDFTRCGDDFDFVLDAVGKVSFFRCRRLLKQNGRFTATDVGPWMQNLPLMLWSWASGNKRVVMPISPQWSARAFVAFLKERLEAGQFRGVIDRTYPLDRIADAYRYVETGQKVGIVVIDVAHANGE